MGAIHKLDLTSDVTHLIVGNVDTAKYKYVAKQRPDVKVLGVRWVEVMGDLWKNAQHINVEEEEQKHRLPAFFDLRICLTGFDSTVA
jgi:DNA replication regulator DPB11